MSKMSVCVCLHFCLDLAWAKENWCALKSMSEHKSRDLSAPVL